MSAEGLIIAPLITEKGTIAGEKANQVIFRVRPEATKDKIRLVVEGMFKVTVMAVRTSNFLGVVGRKPDWKKAYVTLKAGDKIEFFEGI
jgi:large subunit ribosomal protein L23